MATTTFHGKVIQTIGELPNLGEPAPQFTATTIDFQSIKLTELKGHVVVLSTFPSIDTTVSYQINGDIDKVAEEFPNIIFIGISMDLPITLKRVSSNQSYNNTHFITDFRTREFGVNYGVLIKEGLLAGILARSLFVLDKQQTMVYRELTPKLDQCPDLEALRKVLSGFG